MKLVEVIKTMPLSNEETQVLIDALLSKNTEAPTDWINKNDPITVLKKQLEEKELELKKESENHDRAKTRIQDMREEINQEKQKQVSIKEQLNVNVVKIGQLENKLQQSEELKNAELHKLQNNFAQIRDKLSDDLKLAIQQAQKEEERANQAVNQLEQEKRRLELLNFQVMQYNTDRQHFNGLNSNLEKVNEDMKNENNMLKEQISELKNSYDLNEFKRHQHFSEVEQKLTQCLRESEQKAEAATAQLKHISEEFGDQIEKLKRSLFEAQTQHSALLHEKNALEESQQQLRNELAQVKPNAEDANKAVAELLQELDALKQQLANDTTTNKEHLQQLQQQLVAEREKFVLLEEKVKHYEQTLNKVVSIFSSYFGLIYGN